jgi:hypothetical protein
MFPGTNMNDALVTGVEYLGKLPDTGARSQVLVFLTDGQPSTG